MNRLHVLFSAVAVTLGTVASASPTTDQHLETEIRQNSRNLKPAATPPTVSRALKALTVLKNSPQAEPSACAETDIKTFAGKYAITSDPATGRPCRIYDLSFPTLKSFLGLSEKHVVSKIPVERFTSQDYLNWIRGRYDEVYRKISTMQIQTTESAVARASWVSQVRFKPGSIPYAQLHAEGGPQLPRTFHASDLDVGAFKLKDQDQKALQTLVTRFQSLSPSTGIQAGASAPDDFWLATVEKPESFLSKIRFDWNDLEKVYDVALEGQFLPINGPIALVDFNVQYKYAVESILRSTLGSVLGTLARAIPHLPTRNLVYVAVTDSFTFLDLTYQIQLAQLEDTLRSGLNNEIKIETSPAHLQTGLNILFGSGSSLFSEYILSLAQGRSFDWEKMDELGRLARYRAEKTRKINLANLNSQLVLKKGCDVERIATYFAVCSKGGKKDGIYSLMTNQQILMWNLGAPLIHRFDRPSEVLLKRSATWLLSAGIRIFDIPVLPRRLIYNLGYMLQDYAKGGMEDEAYLKNALWLMQRNAGSLSEENEVVMKWLYLQNINPFLPKSMSIERSVISANSALLGISPSGGN